MNKSNSLAVDQMHPAALLRSCIQRVATGPEMSKSISYDEARYSMHHILNQAVDPVQSAVFLIGLRMKRETDDENSGVLQGLIDHTQQLRVDTDDLIDISDPYDGYARTLPASPFLPAVLAACGLPAISQGVESIGPKYGATHRKVLRAAGINVDRDGAQIKALIENPEIGWAYIDQRQFCPKLHDLADLRGLMVKRSALSTVEVLQRPVIANKRTVLMTGFVHKPYPQKYASLARHAGYDGALMVRGVEGGVIPSLQQPARVFSYFADQAMVEQRIEPVMVAIESASRAVPLPPGLPESKRIADAITANHDADAIASAAADAGLRALQGETGAVFDSLVYSGAIALSHMGLSATMTAAAEQVRDVLVNGQAWQRFSRAQA